jgi:hypothetical protein
MHILPTITPSEICLWKRMVDLWHRSSYECPFRKLLFMCFAFFHAPITLSDQHILLFYNSSAAAWDTVEELSAAASHAKAAAKESYQDPLEKYCDSNPDADECRVYDD